MEEVATDFFKKARQARNGLAARRPGLHDGLFRQNQVVDDVVDGHQQDFAPLNPDFSTWASTSAVGQRLQEWRSDRFDLEVPVQKEEHPVYLRLKENVKLGILTEAVLHEFENEYYGTRYPIAQTVNAKKSLIVKLKVAVPASFSSATKQQPHAATALRSFEGSDADASLHEWIASSRNAKVGLPSSFDAFDAATTLPPHAATTPRPFAGSEAAAYGLHSRASQPDRQVDSMSSFSRLSTAQLHAATAGQSFADIDEEAYGPNATASRRDVSIRDDPIITKFQELDSKQRGYRPGHHTAQEPHKTVTPAMLKPKRGRPKRTTLRKAANDEGSATTAGVASSSTSRKQRKAVDEVQRFVVSNARAAANRRTRQQQLDDDEVENDVGQFFDAERWLCELHDESWHAASLAKEAFLSTPLGDDSDEEGEHVPLRLVQKMRVPGQPLKMIIKRVMDEADLDDEEELARFPEGDDEDEDEDYDDARAPIKAKPAAKRRSPPSDAHDSAVESGKGHKRRRVARGLGRSTAAGTQQQDS